jgi:hypothetical protein
MVGMNTPQPTEQPTGQPNGNEGRAKKKPGGRPFTGKDDPRRWQNWEAARAAAGPVPEESPGAEDVSLYATMRAVFNQPPSADRGQPQRECRAWLKADRKGFLSKLADLEKAALAKGQSATAPGDGAERDLGSERVLELLGEEWDEVLRAVESLRAPQPPDHLDGSRPSDP